MDGTDTIKRIDYTSHILLVHTRWSSLSMMSPHPALNGPGTLDALQDDVLPWSDTDSHRGPGRCIWIVLFLLAYDYLDVDWRAGS